MLSWILRIARLPPSFYAAMHNTYGALQHRLHANLERWIGRTRSAWPANVAARQPDKRRNWDSGACRQAGTKHGSMLLCPQAPMRPHHRPFILSPGVTERPTSRCKESSMPTQTCLPFGPDDVGRPPSASPFKARPDDRAGAIARTDCRDGSRNRWLCQRPGVRLTPARVAA